MSSDEEIAYGYRWSYLTGAPAERFSEAEARSRHEAGREYTAILSADSASGRATLVTVVGENDYVEAVFHDALGRRQMSYSFALMPEGHYFLNLVMIWTYPDDDPGLTMSDASVVETNTFKPNGRVTRTVMDYTKNEKETTSYSDVPVDDNWEPAPRFGEFDSIGRWERKRPAER